MDGERERRNGARELALAVLAHVALVLWLLGPLVTGARVLFFRDIAFVNVPDDTFLERSLRAGVWPLWYPDCDAGSLFLATYPVDLLLVWLGGASLKMALGAPLHLVLGMTGLTVLARGLGIGPWPAWAAGALWGVCGWSLSTFFYPLFHAGSWTPWIVVAARAVVERPSTRSTALLGMATALQLSTFGGEVVVQTALLVLAILPHRPGGRALAAGGVAAVLAVLVAAPALVGAREVAAESARAVARDTSHVLDYSIPPVALLDLVLPRFFGDFHGFGDRGSWGLALFGGQLPYVLSLYVSPLVLLLAAFSRRVGLIALVALGVVLMLGAHGPFGPALVAVFPNFRNVPVKFGFLVSFAAVLLAADGLDRVRRGAARVNAAVVGPGAALLVGAGLAFGAPEAVTDLVGRLSPAFGRGGPFVAERVWPAAFGGTGALLLAAGLALRTPRLAPLAAVLAVLDLATVNGGLNPTTNPEFYRLRPEVAALVEHGGRQERWLSFGAAGSPGLPYDPRVVALDRAVWRYHVDVQSLLPRTHVLAALDSAYDADHVGIAPAGAALTVPETAPGRLVDTHRRLRLAGIRWLLSFEPLPESQARRVAQTPLPPALAPLGLYELVGWLPRAYWVPECEVVAPDTLWARALAPDFEPRRRVLVAGSCERPGSAADHGAPAVVRYERVDPHTVRVHADTAPGWLVVLDGYHRDWGATGPEGVVEVRRANGRYRALPTPGGRRTYTFRFRPRWRDPALYAAAVGLAATVLLALRPR